MGLECNNKVKIIYEERAVAFIDVLGFSNLVNRSAKCRKAHQSLEDLVDLLYKAVPLLDALVFKTVLPALIPSYTYISDCIILSAPMTDNACTIPSYDGLQTVAMRCIQLTHLLLQQGYLLSGGIEVGKVWHAKNTIQPRAAIPTPTGANIIGPAYQEAVKLEKKTDQPRIILGKEATKHWKSGKIWARGMFEERDGELMVHGLCEEYYLKRVGCTIVKGRNYSQMYADYRKIINRKSICINCSARKKWCWFSSYLKDSKKKYC